MCPRALALVSVTFQNWGAMHGHRRCINLKMERKQFHYCRDYFRNKLKILGRRLCWFILYATLTANSIWVGTRREFACWLCFIMESIGRCIMLANGAPRLFVQFNFQFNSTLEMENKLNSFITELDILIPIIKFALFIKIIWNSSNICTRTTFPTFWICDYTDIRRCEDCLLYTSRCV